MQIKAFIFAILLAIAMGSSIDLRQYSTAFSAQLGLSLEQVAAAQDCFATSEVLLTTFLTDIKAYPGAVPAKTTDDLIQFLKNAFQVDCPVFEKDIKTYLVQHTRAANIRAASCANLITFDAYLQERLAKWASAMDAENYVKAGSIQADIYRIVFGLYNPNIDPSAEFTTANNSRYVTFDASPSFDPDGSIVSYVWNFGEPSSSNNGASGITTAHTFAVAGTYLVTLTVTDNMGASMTSSQAVTVTGGNIVPIGEFTPTRNRLAVNVDASASHDPDGSITSYAWNFGESGSSSNTGTGSTASHTYAADGTYVIYLTVTDNEGATRTVSRSITVAQNFAPTANFTSSTTYLVASLDASASTDLEGTIATYSWNFGDSGSASNTASGSTATTSHTFSAAGTYTVTLTVTDSDGATNTTTRSVTVVANVPPTATFIYTATYLDVSFDGRASTDSDGSITNYDWNFGESGSSSNTISGASATTAAHLYAVSGTYRVTLTVTDNAGATRTSTQDITIRSPNVAPIASFTTTNTFLTVAFDAAASHDLDGTIARYAWVFGESGSPSNTANGSTATASHTYSAAGTYTVTLTVTDNDGATQATTQTVTVIANVAPTASFTYNRTYLSVAFDGSASTDSDGTITNYAWNFGESGSSSNTISGPSATQPSHTYASSGTYTVSLVVTDNGGGTHTRTQSVTVTANVAPTASFTYLAPSRTLSFDASTSTDSDGTIVSYAWNFGDSGSSSNTGTGVTATHRYPGGGSYTVTLTVTDNMGAIKTTMQGINVPLNVAPTASFTYTRNYLTVSFDGSTSTDSDGTIANYAWNFGESGSSSNTASGSSATATHIYAVGGTYTIILTVTDNEGAIRTTSQSITIRAANVAPTASFTFSSNYLDASFNGAASTDSDGTITNYAWNFGDPSSSSNTASGSSSAGSHRFSASGTYTVTLTVTDNDGEARSTTRSVTVVANTPPIATYTYTANYLVVSFNAAGSSDPDGTITGYYWNFGDSSSSSNTANTVAASHTFPARGTYRVTLTVIDNAGTPTVYYRDIFVRPVNVAPTARFTFSKVYLAVTFDASTSTDSDGTIASYAWNFGDSSTGSGVTASRTYAASGTYTVTLTVTDDEGATHTITQSVSVVANVPPTPSFTYSKTYLAVSFDASASTDSDGTITSYTWNFGDSGTGSGITASRTYSVSGTYSVTLTITDNGGATRTLTQSVTVAANVPPTASFTYTRAYLVANFDGRASTDSDGTITNYAWNFGESGSSSNTATGSTASHTYAAGGTYTVTLTVTDNAGATKTITQSVTVAANVAPTARFTWRSTSPSLSVTFNGGTSTDSDGTISTYAWNFGDSTTGSGVTTSRTYASAGTFTVTLTVTDNMGATHTTTRQITTPGVLTATFTASVSYSNAQFDASACVDTTGGTITSYAWNFGESGSSSNTASGVIVGHGYTSANSFTVTLTVTNSYGQQATTTRTVQITRVVPGGSLQFTIGWNRPGDGDFVVATPTGKVIYWQNKGPSANTDQGTLDPDDTTGIGPENVYFTSAQPPVGTYHTCFQMYNFNPLATESPIMVQLNVSINAVRQYTVNKTFTVKNMPNECNPSLNTYLGSFTYTI